MHLHLNDYDNNKKMVKNDHIFKMNSLVLFPYPINAYSVVRYPFDRINALCFVDSLFHIIEVIPSQVGIVEILDIENELYGKENTTVFECFERLFAILPGRLKEVIRIISLR